MRRVRRVGGGGLVVALIALAIACANGTSTDDGGDITPVEAGTTGRDVNVTPKDSSGGDETNPIDDAGDCSVQKVVINELSPTGPNGASDEFIELYNPSDCAIPLDGWTLKYKSSGNTAGPPLYAFQSGDSIASKGFLLLATDAFSGTKQGTFTAGLSGTGGQVGLVDDNGKLVDGVGYGSSTSGDYTEKSPAAVSPAGQSIARKTDGKDSDDNSADFAVATTPTPGAAN